MTENEFLREALLRQHQRQNQQQQAWPWTATVASPDLYLFSSNPYATALQAGPTPQQAAILYGFTDSDQDFLRSIGVKVP